jgi:hypothetical protein
MKMDRRGEACRRIGVSVCRRIGSKTACRHGYYDQEVSTKLMTHFKTPIHRTVDTFPHGSPF